MPANETGRRESGRVEPVVSVIVPARNEELSLATCLESLVSQTGVAFEVVLVDDHSTDRTREIAASIAGVCVIEAGPLPEGWTGKSNAVMAGVRHARGQWLLFTDADTIHLSGSLARALEEAREHRVEMLSYSPEQIAVSFWERAVLPVVFAELAREYPPSKVSDPNSPIAAANGQYILVKREAYDAVGGHAAIAGEILEDVALARRFKAAGRSIRFRYAADSVRTRMYRNWPQLRDGWTKNLALLFAKPGWLATGTLLVWLILWTDIFLLVKWPGSSILCLSIFFVLFIWLRQRIEKSNFPLYNVLSGMCFGMPMFAYLLLRSKHAHAKGTVPWKGRIYSDKTHLFAIGH